MTTAIEDSRQSCISIKKLKTWMHDSAHRANTIRQEHGDVRTKLQHLEAAHPDWINNPRIMAHYLFVIAGVIAVYFLDFLLFGPTAEILSEKAFYGYPVMIWVAKIIVPAAILLFEIFIALQIYFTKRDAETYYLQSTAYLAWIAIGLFMAVVMPCLVIGTNLIQSSFESEPAKNALLWQRVSLVILALVMHLGVIFGGRHIHDAKAYFAFEIKHLSLRRRNQNCIKAYDNESRVFHNNFDSFYGLLIRHRKTFDEHYDPGPFDSITRNFAREIYGYDEIPDPNFAHV
jgi:hypothetical protein